MTPEPPETNYKTFEQVIQRKKKPAFIRPAFNKDIITNHQDDC